MIYAVSQKTRQQTFVHIRQILIDFKNYFTVTLGRKFATKRSLQLPTHLKGVATLLCDSKNCTD